MAPGCDLTSYLTQGPPSLSFLWFAEPKLDTTSRHFHLLFLRQEHSSFRLPKAKSLSFFRYQVKVTSDRPFLTTSSSLLPVTITTPYFISFITFMIL